MNRFHNNSKADMHFSPANSNELARNMRDLAEQIKASGRRRMMLGVGCARQLRKDLDRAEELRRIGMDEGDALRRFHSDARRIEACLQAAQLRDKFFYPSSGRNVRVLTLARNLVENGEQRLDQERICAGVAAFDAAQPLEMQEILAVPAALRIALCEALRQVSASILRQAEARRRAEKWIDRNGRMRVRCDELFFEHALRQSVEQERPDLHARLEGMLEECGCREDWAVERAHRLDAENALRLDHLMQLRYLLDSMDWQLCFERISTAEIELWEDPANVYANMDAASRSRLRRAVAQIARNADVAELTVVRFALAAARSAREEFGAVDPRATVCYYLADDAGREHLRWKLGVSRRLCRVVPDRRGWISVGVVCGLMLVVAALCLWAIGEPILMIYALPLAWVAAMQLISRFYPRWVKPRNLLKMKIHRVPDSARTLVVLPVLLSSEERAREMIAHMESLGCLETDPNIDYLLLGDFRDADSAHLPDDAAILQVCREAVFGLNAREGREKYFYLHRERRLLEKDARWMGEGRKRGALTALNRLILMQDGTVDDFAAESGAAGHIAGRYRYVVTLDADTEYLPGTLQKLIGTMMHPLNRSCIIDGKRRGYAVLQPNMQMTMQANENAYVELSSGRGGVDSYPVSVSDFYQDMTGSGNFSGKGIYDVAAFASATDGKLPDAEILSHDLIEGILCGAGFLNDVRFYDGVPTNLHADLNRQHRWIRGDWQLLRVLFSRLPIRAVDRMKMIGNLLRSLHAPALLGLLIHSVWLDLPDAFLLGLLLNYLDPILFLFRGGAQSWRRATLQLALLPAATHCILDAVVRAVWRLFISRKHLLDWVPAADAARNRSGKLAIPGRIAAILLLPGLLRSFWIPAVLALAALFWVGTGWAEDLSCRSSDENGSLKADQIAMLGRLARETWTFFEKFVPEDGPGIPPDNVQIDPPVGIAGRTSPTNIGLYMLSCLAAKELGFIADAQLLRRLSATVFTLESMEKWNGQLYNWYDLTSLTPLRPRYVSAVDSGNLTGSLLLCGQMIAHMDEQLSQRIRKLAAEMNLAALYDEQRHLFRIGADVENARLSEAHYDLYASEARILSYSAMMLGQVPVKHWQHLSRPSISVGRERALLSWSGTMFEYLMPELLLHSHVRSLAGQTRRAVVAAQMRFGRRRGRPWGVSESGYSAFDLHLNYQYHAFGIKELALSGEAAQDVVAPYAAVLALCCDPSAAAQNLRRMRELGWCGEFGMYEAADYLHLDGAQAPRIVKSHMAHHQGMALCALCNALRDDVLSRRFMEIPQAQALRLLLQEKPSVRLHIRREKPAHEYHRSSEPMRQSFRRIGRTDYCAVDAHLLHGRNTTVLLTALGSTYVWRDGLQMNRFAGDLQTTHEGMYVHLHCLQSGECAVFGSGGRVEFDAGNARCELELKNISAELRLCVSPEDGTLYQQVEIENNGDAARTVEITGCFAVALAADRDMRAHPVFQNLFIECQPLSDRVLLLRRKPRNRDGAAPELIYLVSGDGEVQWETDMEKLTGRIGSLGRPGGIAREFAGRPGSVINPCAALRIRMELDAKEKKRVHFALCGEGENWRQRSDPAAPERAMNLAAMHARAALHFSGVDGRKHRLLQRAAAFLYDGRLHPGLNLQSEACEPMGRESLWKTGISGDQPILLAEVKQPDQLDCVRDLIHAHNFYRMMGVQTDLVLMYDYGNDYRRPVQSALEDLINSSHLCALRGVSGGVFVLDRENMDESGYAALNRAAVLRFSAKDDFTVQLRAALDVLNLRETAAFASMRPGELAAMETPKYFNGYGGFDGEEYVILLKDGMLPPAPWSNLLAAEHSGAILTERGGGFAWRGNSRSGRLTEFANDALREGWGWMFYLVDEKRRGYLRLLPGDVPMTDFCVRYAPGTCAYEGKAEDIAFILAVRPADDGVRFELTMENRGANRCSYRIAALVDWLMGTDSADLPLLRTWSRFGACFASGASGSVGYFAVSDPMAAVGCSMQDLFSGGDMMRPKGLSLLERPRGGWTLHLPVELGPGEKKTWRFALGAADNIPAAYAKARGLRSGEAEVKRGEIPDNLRIETPDEKLNLLFNGFLHAQVLHGRICARTGLYQPGGAYGFRDQLQDMLPMIYYDPDRVRRHLLYCAARQFKDGDVLHWWHEPYTGVRTKIRDDLLFLPYVTARYVEITGDASVLAENVPFLMDITIPDGKEDIYAPMQPSADCASLHQHCMRAFRHAAQFGEHGLCLMGGGDWNDGMNRVGILGRGESIWLSEFLAACAADYARVAPDEGDKAWLMGINERLCTAIEANGWDGKWYLRAYADDGSVLGGKESPCCRIDAISQAWSVLADLDPQRCRSAMNAAWDQLVDEELKLIRLLTPPFDRNDMDPGYIAAYPSGIRENGAQYTHGACWLALAWIRMGDAERAHRALEMLLPLNHADSREAADIYRVEPYVMAADVYTNKKYAGRGGWTWYTGSASWMMTLILALMGFERRENRVRMLALLGEWKQAEIRLKFGSGTYRLICTEDAGEITLDGDPIQEEWIEMRDDGEEHIAVFPARLPEKDMNIHSDIQNYRQV